MAGPMTYDQWEACFMVFRSAWSCWSSQARLPLMVIATTSASTVLGSGHSVRLLSIKPILGLESVFAEGQTQSSRLQMPLGSKARTIPNAHGSTSSGSFQLSLLSGSESWRIQPC